MSILSPVRNVVSEGLRWPRYMYDQYTSDGIEGLQNGLYWTQRKALVAANRGFVEHVHNPGTPIWEYDWDVLVILDACRLDLMMEVAASGTDHHVVSGPEAVDSVWSLGSMSSDWLRRNFTEAYRDEIRKTAYITGNPYAATADLDSDSAIIKEGKRPGAQDIIERNVPKTGRPNLEVEPAIIEELWQAHWDEEVSTIPARPITDSAIKTWRNRPPDVEKMIVHYMQPHTPFVNYPDMGNFGDASDFGVGFEDLWSDQVGDSVPKAKVWEAYRDNLEYVLEDVSLLLDNLDANKVAISADHGNAIGEYGFYGHRHDIIIPQIRRVPWIETSGHDTGEYHPADEAHDDTIDGEIADRLADLGYV